MRTLPVLGVLLPGVGVALTICFTASSLHAQDVPWFPSCLTADSEAVVEMQTGDLDGDGDPDLATATAGDRVVWYANRSGDGADWSPERLIATGVGDPTSLSVVDLDGDGDQDLVTSSRLDNAIRWFENVAGDGTAWTSHLVSDVALQPLDAVVADVDADGDPDVLVASKSYRSVVWHENVAGDASRWRPHVVGTSIYAATSVAVADIDGDGDVDILATYSRPRAVGWYENVTGDGGSWSAHPVPIPASVAEHICAVDADRDGDLDIAYSVPDGTPSLDWAENLEGNGLSWAPYGFMYASHTWEDLFAIDVDADGAADLVAVGGGHITYLENIEAGKRYSPWRLRTIRGALPDSVGAVCVVDLDDDGMPEVVGAFGSRIQIFVNASDDPWFDPVVTIDGELPKPVAVTAADLDGDGDRDVVSAMAEQGLLRWHQNLDGDGTAWSSRRVTIGVSEASSVVAMDLDGDGDQDLLSGSHGQYWSEGEVFWHENVSGDASSWLDHSVSSDVLRVNDVFSADVDGDGDPDALSVSEGDDLVAWHENVTGDAAAWVMHAIPSSAADPQSVVGADLDGDGDQDVLVAFEGDGTIRWFENEQGDGSVWSERLVTANLELASCARAVDMDHDGDLDVLWTAQGDGVSSDGRRGKIAWEENLTGDGLSWLEHLVHLSGSSWPVDADALDVDGDGALEVAVAFYGWNLLAVYDRAPDDCEEWHEYALDRDAGGISSVCATDIDGDQVPDLLAALRHGHATTWYQTTRQENRVFAEFTASPVTGQAPLIVQFQDLSSGPGLHAWSWDFGDGGQSTEQHPAHEYPIPGSFTVSLFVSGSGDADRETKHAYLVIDGDEATVTERNGSGVNPTILTSTTRPVIGTTWCAGIDAGAVGGAGGITVLHGFAAPALLSTPLGELLVDPTTEAYLTSTAFVIGGTADHEVAVPNDPSLNALPVFTQALVLPPRVLTNALDLVLGTQ